MTLSLGTAYRSFGGEMEASSTPMICRLLDSCRPQLSAIAPPRVPVVRPPCLLLQPLSHPRAALFATRVSEATQITKRNSGTPGGTNSPPLLDLTVPIAPRKVENQLPTRTGDAIRYTSSNAS